jgi:hypothetical protein
MPAPSFAEACANVLLTENTELSLRYAMPPITLLAKSTTDEFIINEDDTIIHPPP